MKIRRVYSPTPPGGQQELTVNGEEFHHLKTVLKAAPGERIDVFDARGTLYQGILDRFDQRSARVRVEQVHRSAPSPIRLIVAVSVLKRKSMFSLVDTLSETGADQIIPVIFSRTDVPYYPKHLVKWQSIARMSLRINGQLWPTRVEPPIAFGELLERGRSIREKIFLDLDGRENFKPGSHRPLLVVIGPPGDFTPAERKQLAEQGFGARRINDCILRSETAAISLAAIVKNSFLK